MSCTQPCASDVPGIKFRDREILRHSEVGLSVTFKDPLQTLLETGHRTSKASHVVLPCATDRLGDPTIPSSTMATNLKASYMTIVFSLDSVSRRALGIGVGAASRSACSQSADQNRPILTLSLMYRKYGRLWPPGCSGRNCQRGCRRCDAGRTLLTSIATAHARITLERETILLRLLPWASPIRW